MIKNSFAETKINSFLIIGFTFSKWLPNNRLQIAGSSVYNISCLQIFLPMPNTILENFQTLSGHLNACSPFFLSFVFYEDLPTHRKSAICISSPLESILEF